MASSTRSEGQVRDLLSSNDIKTNLLSVVSSNSKVLGSDNTLRHASHFECLK